MCLPLHLGGLERVAGAPRNQGLLTLLAAGAGLLLCRWAISPWGNSLPALGHLRTPGPCVGLALRRHGLRQPGRVVGHTIAVAAIAARAGLAATCASACTAAAAADGHRPQCGADLLRAPGRLFLAPAALTSVSVSAHTSIAWMISVGWSYGGARRVRGRAGQGCGPQRSGRAKPAAGASASSGGFRSSSSCSGARCMSSVYFLGQWDCDDYNYVIT